MSSTEVKAKMKIGGVVHDKTIYAGKVNGVKIYAAPQDAKQADGMRNLSLSFDDAADYADKLNRENYLGHSDWHVPSELELYVLFANKNKGALKETFNSTSLDRFYWSSTPCGDYCAFERDFGTGDQTGADVQGSYFSVRCVR